jgi:hypothetical protein
MADNLTRLGFTLCLIAIISVSLYQFGGGRQTVSVETLPSIQIR